MENIQQSPEWSQPEDREGSESSSQTAVEESTTSYSDFNHHNHHDHILRLVSSLHTSLHTTLRSLTQTIYNQRTEISNLTATVDNQRDRIEELQLLESTRFRHSRHEILDAFALRGVMGREEWQIVGCDTRHHYGDAVEDAMLYIRGYRRDFSVWGRLYSLTPQRVMECYRAGDNASIDVLDKRATLLLTRENGDAVLPAIEGAYRRFVYLLEQRLVERPGEDMSSPLTRTYQRFWEICRAAGF